MKIAFILFRGEPTRGGAEQYVDTLGHALIGRGHDVSLLASRFGDTRKIRPVTIRASGLTRTARYHRFLCELEAHLARERYDVVHACLPVRACDVYHAHAGLEAVSLRDSHQIKSSLPAQVGSMLAHRLDRKRRAFARVEASLLNGPTPPVTVCLSDRERLVAENLFPSARSRLVTLHSVPDDAQFAAGSVDGRREKARKQLGVNAAQTLYLFVGQDFQRKGLATAIRALGELGDPNALLYVLGGGDVVPYSRIASRAGVIGRVLFAGAVPNVVDFLSAADALVLPSRYEPFGMVTVEAMLMGVPPIVSAVAGSSEVVANDRTGYVVDSLTDIAAWAHAMRRVADAGTRTRLSANCLRERERFSYIAHVDAIEAVHRQVANHAVIAR